ncbi:P-loop containing nucleoside triphosphate hydrolase protein [Crucibulum laeve]|uniref:Structural maintenance of chromosomes protein 5 n=1 Tax=Crucibulum laeve TaxID=68775 RepID=A0A5C3MJA4_9AGAR|nr:P-loop containing nucleoside triphosphate hydrolase protein [Crucibulum laeve]
MTRRSVRANGDFSAKESAHVKLEKVKEERRDKGKQRARIEETEDEEPPEEDSNGDAAGEEYDEGQHASPRGSKRMRINGDGESRPNGSGSQEELVPRMKTLPRGKDGYIPGSITRIQVRNFVTYDYVQFRPGPYLNMIVGPNGTGKSSIACAIALGLNFPPSVLGRASELNSFVKIGTDVGYIEIELKGPNDGPNLVIRRSISSKSKGSSFTLNGESATGTEIKHKMNQLGVQVGNLCSFLPQDKVSEFAAMSPQQLLRETQRAAGDQRLTEWHDTLISSGKDLRGMTQLLADENNQLTQMNDRNDNIEREVQRFKERKRIEHTIELLELLRPVQEYREKRLQYNATKARQRALHQKVLKLKAKNEPAHELLKKLEESHKSLERERDDMKKSTQAKFRTMSTKWSASDKLESEAEDITTRLGQLKRDEKERARKIKTLEMDIAKLEEHLAKPPTVKLEKMEDLNAEAQQINLERSSLVARKGELDQKIKELIEKKTYAQRDLQQAQAELGKLDSADQRKLAMLQRWDRDTHDAILWLRSNKRLFKMEVFEPPFMCLTLKDRRYTNAVEACFSQAQMKTFIAQCQEDSDTLNHHINDSAGLGRKARVTTFYRENRDDLIVPPPMTRDEMQALGFDGYALDYVEYPAGMRYFLTRDVMMHRTAIALNPNKIDVNKAMQAVSRADNGKTGGATFISGTTLNTVNRSRYGKRAVANMTKDVPPARNLVVPTIDPEQKRQIDDSIQRAKQEIGNCDIEKQSIDAEMAEVLEGDKEFQKRHDSVKSRKDAIKAEGKRKATAQSKLSSYRSQLHDRLNAPSVADERARLKKSLLNITKKRLIIARDYTGLARAIIDEQVEATRVGLQYLQVSANKTALDELCKRKDEKFRTALILFNEVDAQFKKIKAESHDMLTKSQNILKEAPEDLKEEYMAIEKRRLAYEKALAESQENGTPPNPDGVEQRTLEELQSDLETERASLDLVLGTNPGVLEEYEKRQRDIERLKATIEERQRKADKVERQIKTARDNWKPALEQLVASIGEKFSAAFDRIGCAGEIRISEHEDYEKWAIDILVKFRDSEKLQLLTGQRQSGGERSLTTILYLMSLTEEARAPFSLVDEINQGMDQRAERMVHNSMVDVTCKEESAQYFLITPKLLPDLNYHERMKILCVNNGEWLPEEKNLGNMRNMIDDFVNQQKK